MQYISRVIEEVLARYIKSFPVIGLTGPRQSGKSTLLINTLKKYKYITFDSEEVRSDYYSDPKRFIAEYNNKIIFDEVQKVPELFNDIKIAVDNDRDNYGKYILTGSSQFNMIKGITETLAGRIGLLSLLPFQYSETPENNRYDSIYKGNYPELVNRNFSESRLWYDSYITTYIEKDVRQLVDVGDIRDFSRLVKYIAANCSEALNMSSYASNLGVAVSTIKRWVSVLEASYIIFLLPPFYKNYGKRVTKTPKVYFYDTGLAAYLTKNDTQAYYENGPLKGELFENYIISQIKKEILHRKLDKEMYYFRTSNGVEIDCILDDGHKHELLEIKSSSTFRPDMLKPIKSIITDGDKGSLVYMGESRKYTDNIELIHYNDLLLGLG